jgi:hypothetical protein
MIWILRPSVSEERADAGDWAGGTACPQRSGADVRLSVSTERLTAPEGAGIHLMVLTGSARYVQARRCGNPPHAGIGTGATQKIFQRLTRRAPVDLVPSPLGRLS